MYMYTCNNVWLEFGAYELLRMVITVYMYNYTLSFMVECTLHVGSNVIQHVLHGTYKGLVCAISYNYMIVLSWHCLVL